ncbi:MAG: Sll0314/Alr1548 family TPR repeat-containing protein [Cyanobacteria bacterium J06634_6]
MALQPMTSLLHLSNRSSRSLRKRTSRIGGGLLALGLSLSMAMPTFAADPFRGPSSNRIDATTEEAFLLIFKESKYEDANAKLKAAEAAGSSEPLVYAMLASTAYLEGDNGLDQLYDYAVMTEEKAQALKASDPLRGHLYTAVGVFLQGAHLLQVQGVAEGTPEALGMLQEVFSELDAAEAVDPTDAELNLLKGYMDLMLAVNLPFSNPEDAISRISQYGSPTYLAQRGLAIGYRDLEDYDNALDSVNAALAEAQGNPELLYLKAQILSRQGSQAQSESLDLFNQALAEGDQLPDELREQIGYEKCRMVNDGTDCIAVLRGEIAP